MVVDNDPGLAGIRKLRTLHQFRPVCINDDEQRHVCHHPQSLLRLDYVVYFSIRNLVINSVERFVVLLYDYV